MMNVKLIFSKELRSYFDSPIAYIFVIIFLMLSGVYFAGNVFLLNEASLRSLFDAIPVLLLFFVPAITMRLISEEKKSGTFEILGTKPIRTGEIVLGKFLAAWFLVLVAMLPTLCYLITVALLGPLDLGAALGGYFGVLLMGGALVAIGLMGSACSQNQIIAFIISFVIGLVLFVADRILVYVPMKLVWVLEYLSINHHVSSFSRGVLDSRDFVYHLSVIGIALALATVFAGLETPRAVWKLREVGWKEQFLRIALLTAILFFANILSINFFTRIDLTGSKSYTLSDGSIALTRGLEDNFIVTGYFSHDLPPPYHNHRRRVQELLDEYRAYAPDRFHYRFVNPLAEPEFEDLAVRDGISPVQVKVIRNDRFETEKAYAGLAFTYGEAIDHLSVVSSPDYLEYDITSSLRRLAAPEKPTAAFLTRRGESVMGNLNLLQTSLSAHYKITTVDISVLKNIPDDTAVLIVASPGRRFTDREKFLIDQYIMGGGKVAFFINNVATEQRTGKVYTIDLNLDDMFDTYGWVVNEDLVADARCARMPQAGTTEGSTDGERSFQYFPLVSELGLDHPAVKNCGPVMFPYVSSIDTRLAAARGLKAKGVATSSNKARRVEVREFNMGRGQEFPLGTLIEQDIALAATIEGRFKSVFAKRRVVPGERGTAIDTVGVIRMSPNTRMVVVGDGDFANDQYAAGNDNITFAASLVDWLVDDSGLAAIPRNETAARHLNEISQSTKEITKYINVGLPPGVVVLAGLFRMAARKARRRKHMNSI